MLFAEGNVTFEKSPKGFEVYFFFLFVGGTGLFNCLAHAEGYKNFATIIKTFH